MAHVFVTLTHDPTVRPLGSELISQLGPAAAELYRAFLHDSLDLVGRIARVRILALRHASSTLIAQQPTPIQPESVALPDMHSATIAHMFAHGLLSGPAILLRGDLPHLPIWRLRDALTHLEGGSDLVIGPGERGSWYLIGMRAAHPALLRAMPGRDEPPDDLCIAAATHGLRMAQLPAWYTLDTLADLERLAADLRTMPPDVGRQTRTLLDGEGAQARAVGG